MRWGLLHILYTLEIRGQPGHCLTHRFHLRENILSMAIPCHHLCIMLELSTNLLLVAHTASRSKLGGITGATSL